MLKLQTGFPRDFPTNELLNVTQELSVHQLIAYYSLLQVHKTLVNKKPSYIYDKFEIRNPQDGVVLPHRQFSTIAPINRQLNLSRAGFICRGSQLFNLLPWSYVFAQNINSSKWMLKNGRCQILPSNRLDTMY